MMNAAWNSVLVGLPVLLIHLAVAAGLLVGVLALYIWLTPFRELELVRQGNMAAAIMFSGQMLSVAIPVAAMLASSVNIADVFVWGVIIIVLQALAILALRLIVPGMPERVARGEIEPAVVFACATIVAGLLTAAAISA